MELSRLIAQNRVRQKMNESSQQWEMLKSKSVKDFDGFNTDYTMYTDGTRYVCVFGDTDLYSPEDGDFDFETESRKEAYEWFDNYNGLDDGDDDLPFGDKDEYYPSDEDLKMEKSYRRHADDDAYDRWQMGYGRRRESKSVKEGYRQIPRRYSNSDLGSGVSNAKQMLERAKRYNRADDAWALVDFLWDTQLLDQIPTGVKESLKKDINEAYRDDYIKVANSTSRSGGASAIDKDGNIRSVTARYVMKVADKNDSILDFGAGKSAVQANALKDKGFTNVTAYDFGSNSKEGIHDPQALSRTYDIVFASNVLNVSSDEEMLRDTLSDIWKSVKSGGRAIFNYPGSPRKAGFSAQEVQDIIEDIYSKTPTIVVGPKSTPVWEVIK